ncbi:MAG: metallophosphoesterase [Promethearchaeota archaeon]
MKILTFSDFHGLFGLIDHYIDVKKKIEQYHPDLLLLCGDLQDRGSVKLLENRIHNLQFSPIFFVWGNSEEQVDPSYELKNAINIHLKIKNIADLHFIGLGGDEYDVRGNISEIRRIILDNPLKGEQLILISHIPPYKSVDLCNDGRNVGVIEYRDLITEFQPMLVICGHVHEEVQKIAYIDSSMICNVGSRGVLFTIKNNNITTLMLD